MKIKIGLLLLLVFTGFSFLGASQGYSQDVIALASGGDHTVALRVDGTVWTWGRNANGQLGDGSWTYKDVPTRVAMLRDIVSVAAGGSYSFSTGTALAVRSDGTVWAWGWNDKGQLGNGTTTDQPTPVQVKDPLDSTGFLTGAIAVAAGERHSLALKANGTVWAWGYNGSGQLGDSQSTDKLTPVRVKDPSDASGFLTGVKAIAAGALHSIALKNDKTVWTWGSQGYMQLGRTSSSPPQNVAGQVAGMTEVKAIAGGWEHTVVLKGDGTVWAAGRNLEGQLGDGTTIGSSLSPLKLFVQVIDSTDPTGHLTGIGSIDADDRHTVAAKQNGSVYGWGWNYGGKLCDSITDNKLIPMKMKDPSDPTTFLSGVDSVAAGGVFNLMLKGNGTIWGCGYNYSGQLGDGTLISPRTTPVKALLPQYSLIYAWGAGNITPGEEATYLIEYNNVTTGTLQDVVVIFDLPAGFGYASSTNNGIYRDDRNQVFWKLGNLNPGAKGLLSLKVGIPWGLPLHQKITMFVNLVARSIASNVDVDDYLNYVPVEVISEKDYTAGEIDALLSSDLKLKELLDYALSLGYVFDQVAQRYDLSDGSTSLVLALLNPGQPSPVFLKKVGDTVFMEKYEGTAYSLFDKNGGFSVDSNDGSFKSWGTWAVAHSLSQDRCTLNCLVQNPDWNRYVSTKIFKQTSRDCIACQQALKAKKTDPLSCAACARLYVSIHGLHPVIGQNNHSKYVNYIGRCINDCQADSNKWQCLVGETLDFCGFGIASYLFGYNPPFVFHLSCKIEGGGSRWVNEELEYCEAYEICIDTPSPHCAAPCELEVQRTQSAYVAAPPLACETYLMPVVSTTSVPHDPNAKSVDFKGNVIPGQKLTYTIDYENVGEATAYGVFILDELDPNLDESTRVVNNGGTYSSASRLLGWDIGTVAAKGKGSVTFSVNVKSGLPSGTAIKNMAEVYFPSVNEITPTNPLVNTVEMIAADPKTVETNAKAVTPITLSGRDSGSKALTYRITQTPSFGTIAGMPPSVTYTSMEDFSGQDEFYYVVNNGLIDSDPARVLLKVNPSLSDVNSPTVVVTYPNVNATDVHVDPNPLSTTPSIYRPSFWATFSEPMDPTTVTGSTFTVSGGMTGIVTYDELTWTAYFAPSKALSPSFTYTAQLAKGIKDKAGNALAADYSWKFTTASAVNLQVALPDLANEINFGDQAVNILSPAKTVSLGSTGIQNLNIGTVSVTGANSNDFKVVGDTCSGKTFTPSQNCTVQVAFQPISAGQRTGSLSIPSNDPDLPSATILLKGQGIGSGPPWFIWLPLIMQP